MLNHYSFDIEYTHNGNGSFVQNFYQENYTFYLIFIV